MFKAEPDWRRLPAESPEVIHRLLRRRLQKDRSRRLKSADAVRIEIEEAFSLPTAVTVPQARVIQNPRLAWIVAAITTLVSSTGSRRIRGLMKVWPNFLPTGGGWLTWMPARH